MLNTSPSLVSLQLLAQTSKKMCVVGWIVIQVCQKTVRNLSVAKMCRKTGGNVSDSELCKSWKCAMLQTWCTLEKSWTEQIFGREGERDAEIYTVQADWKEWPARGWYRKLGERPDSVHDLDHRAMCDTARCFKHYIWVGLTPNSIFEILQKMSLAT